MNRKITALVLIGSHLGYQTVAHSMEQTPEVKNIVQAMVESLNDNDLSEGLSLSRAFAEAQEKKEKDEAIAICEKYFKNEFNAPEQDEFDPELAAALALSMETGQNIQEAQLTEITKDLCDQVKIMINLEIDKITSQNADYIKNLEDIADMEKSKQLYIDANRLDSYNKGLAMLNRFKEDCYSNTIKPLIDALMASSEIQQLIMDKTGLTPAQTKNVIVLTTENDPDIANAFLLSLETGIEVKEQQPTLELTKELYEQIGVIINTENKKIESQFPEYAKIITNIDNHEKIQDHYRDSGRLEHYYSDLAVLETKREYLYKEMIKPCIDSLDIHQIIMKEIPNLTSEQTHKILEDLGY